MNARRVFVLVIDAFGVGGLPDAPEYGDSEQFNTLGGIEREAAELHLPHLERLGLGHLFPMNRVKPVSDPIGSWGKMAEFSKGKDTTTGHWEMAGIYLDTPFPTYPDGFPPEIIERFKQEAGVEDILGNVPASGTTIIEELGPKHLETGWPIVYTSADSVFQIAAHTGPESKVTLPDLYSWCEKAREILDGEHKVSRVIARPFEGQPGSFKRVGNDRRDYAVTPFEKTTLVRVKEQGGLVIGVGKIEDIFCFEGLTHSLHTGNNPDGLRATEQLVRGELALDEISLEKKPVSDYPQADKQFVFINLVDTDSIYGHRRDVDGYARALMQIDEGLGRLLPAFGEDDLLLITADHGCDPTAPGSDHTREYVPILMYGKSLPGRDLGIRESFADVGRTVLGWLEMAPDGQRGRSLLESRPEPVMA